MRKLETGGVEYYAFENLSAIPSLRHAVLTRRGPGGAEWTMSFSSPAGGGLAAESLRAVERAFGTGPVSIIGQVHGDEALLLEPGEVYGPKSPEEMREGYDAIIGTRGQTLMVRLADCQGIILADPERGLVAAVHSGWRGSALNIAGKAVARLAGMGSSPNRILAGIGPSLGPCCAEMVNYRKELPPGLWAFKADKPDHFDFWAMTRHQLERAGVPSENIETAGICTKCHPDFYSYRRGDAGRFGILAGAI
jgi:YfiH family protein